LDPSELPKEKVIKTLIYGVKSSGNQAERGLRETVCLFADKYPEVYSIVSKDVSKDVYVDDCISGCSTHSQSLMVADQLKVVVNHGGFALKGFTFSGQHPQQSLSTNGNSISVAGLKWYPKEEDNISLDVQELNFAKQNQGRKTKNINAIPANLTRRQYVSKVAELFDITGLITPIVATMKIDLHDLVK